MVVGREKIEALVETSFDLMDTETLPDSVVGVAMLIVEVKGQHGETAFFTFCTDKREWIQKAMVHEAQQAIEFSDVEASEADGE